jgi:serine/threonine-protein kinase
MDGHVVADRYRLVRLLGSGSMGAVWLARDESTGVDVAVKLLVPELAARADAQARLVRETQLAERVDSAHVARVRDHGVTTDGHPYLVMDYVPGTTLRERLAEEAPLALTEIAAIVADVCRGLAAAHAAGLVHRDLKPENILLAGDQESATILDLGSAKATDLLGHPGVDPTRTGDLVGTPYYMSPEQAQGLTTVDHRADLWALGVVVFECATGERPFEARALGPLVAKILTGPIPVPSQIAPAAGLPPELDAWTAKALARDPAARFASATELADALAGAARASRAVADREDEVVRQAWDAGDMADAASAAIARLGPEILRYLGSQMPLAAADDAFSLFLERIWSSLPRFEWRCSLRTWAYLIAKRAAVDVARVEGRRQRRQQPLSESRVAAVAEQVRTATLPLLQTEGRTALARLRDELPHADKMLLVLRIDRGLAWEDVACVFLEKDAPTTAELRRESARLRKRFQIVTSRLRERARAAGIVE